MKLYYNNNGTPILLAEVTTNHSMSIDNILDLVGIDMDKWAEDQGWDNWDFDDLYIEA